MNNTFEARYLSLRAMLDRHAVASTRQWHSDTLNDACRFVLSASGKRVRSVLLLLSCEAVGGRAARVLDAGVAVEALHNFTLVHDDIMDNAPSRRGRPTVHIKWDINTALLVGDVILGLGYANLARTKTRHTRRIMQLFTEGMLEVCEGQALDLEFEWRRDITLRDYFRMIEKKTARLISMSTELGAILGGGKRKQIDQLREFGFLLGRAFQLQDDLLDVVAEGTTFGKAIGGDICEGKKTYLLLSALKYAQGKDATVLKSILTLNTRGNRVHLSPGGKRELVRRVTAIYEKYGILDRSRSLIRRNTDRAIHTLSSLPRNRGTEMLRWFAGELVHRDS